MWFTMDADPKLQVSADPQYNQVCWGNIWHSYLFQATILVALMGTREGPQQWTNRCGTPNWPTVAHCFSCHPGVWRCIFLLDLRAHTFFAFKALRLYSDSIYRFVWLRPCSVCKSSFGTWVWSWDQTVSTEAGWKCLWPNFFRKGLLQIRLPVFQPLAFPLAGLSSRDWLKTSLWPGSSGTKLSS